ncbi:glycoside hydrolase family 18 protein [Portibacter lacus]|nr:glycoside hydrolase family 18 protein [Portibacter lacus]
MKLILLLFSILFSLANSSVQLSEDPVIMAYYVPERDYKPEQIPVEKLTHIIYSFSKVIDGKMQLSNPRKAGEKLKQLVDQKKRNKDLKVMIACGGWGAGGFSEMAWTPEGRNKFVESAIAFIEEYKLDGMDMDWEYPTSSSAGIGASPEDKQNFTSLMKQLREALDELDRPQVLTFASAGWKDYYNYIETEEVMKYVDYMNVMTYDQIVSTSPYTGHHTPLGYITEVSMEGYPLYEHMQSRKEEMAKRGRTWEPRSVKKIIEFCLAQGVKPEQLVIGAAFYGRAWKGVDPAMNGLYQKNRGEYIGWSAYSQIRSEFEKDKNFTRHWDSIAMAPYLYSVKDSIFITYDDPESVTLKTRYAIEEKLGGIMFWQLGNDTKEENGLLDAIYEESVR